MFFQVPSIVGKSMRSLFFKIFIWFWLSMVLLGGAAYISFALLSSDNLLFRVREQTLARLARAGLVAAGLHNRMEAGAVDRFFKIAYEESGFTLFLYSGTGELIHGKRPPIRAGALVKSVLATGSPQFKFWIRYPLAAKLIHDQGDRKYIILAQFPESRFYHLFRPTPQKFIHLLTLLAVSGLICFLLARHITKPVEQLKVVSRKIARGQFGERVASDFGGRRDELYELALDLDDMAVHIEALIKSKEALMRDMSHELRSPMARLKIALELAAQDASEQNLDNLDLMNRQVDTMNRLIGQMLTLARIQTPDAPLEVRDIDLGQLIWSIKVEAEFEASKQNCRVAFENKDGFIVSGNYDLLYSAVENILRNAIRHTPEKTVKISLSQDNAAGNIVINIKDQGPGIPERDLPKLFDPFFQVKKAPGTSGLGLSIAKRAVQRHDGTITASNASEGGLDVRISLPVI